MERLAEVDECAHLPCCARDSPIVSSQKEHERRFAIHDARERDQHIMERVSIKVMTQENVTSTSLKEHRTGAGVSF